MTSAISGANCVKTGILDASSSSIVLDDAGRIGAVTTDRKAGVVDDRCGVHAGKN